MCPKYEGNDRRGEPCCDDLETTKAELYKLKNKIIWFGGALSVLIVIMSVIVVPLSFRVADKLFDISQTQAVISASVTQIRSDMSEMKKDIKSRYGYLKKRTD